MRGIQPTIKPLFSTDICRIRKTTATNYNHNYMKYKLILASGSPRRHQLMKDAGLQFEIRIKNIPEEYPATLKAKDVPLYLAQLKAEPFKSELKDDELLITADTIVCLDAKVIGKPTNREDAIHILHTLSGRKHTVVTGVCLTSAHSATSFSSHTDVYFRALSDEEIIHYVDTFKPFDKAGAYGIQEWIGYIGIERIDGSFYNVMGLPVQALYQEISRIENNKND